MRQTNNSHSLFRHEIPPFILRMIEKIIDNLSFRKGDDQNYISYNLG